MKNTKITCSAAELKVLVIQKPCKSMNFHMIVISLKGQKCNGQKVQKFNTSTHSGVISFLFHILFGSVINKNSFELSR